jgi:hypothetical protein
MRNLLFSLLLIMLSICSLAEEAVRVIHWQKMIGVKHPEMQIYFDPATVRQEVADGIKYGYGAILFHRKYPVDVKVDGNQYTTTSLVMYYIVSCDKHLIASVVDYYFDLNRLVVINDEPLLVVDHSKEEKAAKEISKDHPFYKTLCPEYI